MKKGNKLIKYFEKLTQADTNESSKRFSFLYIVLVLISFVVFMYTDSTNNEIILVELIGFASALAYVNSKERTNKQNEHDEKTNDRTDSPSDVESGNESI